MKRVVCWNEAYFSDALATDADRMTAATFMAVHTPMHLRRQDLRTGAQGEDVTYLDAGTLSEAQVLQDFLDPNRDFVLMPVLGTVGSGKSHLVRWISEHVTEENGKRRIIRVPRTSNVRRVLLDMLDGLEDAGIAEIRKEIERAGGQLKPGAARVLLHGQLVLYAGPESPEPPDTPSREEKIAATYAETLLLEKMIRDKLLAEGGVIDCVAREALRGDDATPGDERKNEFTIDDLPLDLDDRDLANLGREQQLALQKLHRTELREGLVRYLNRALRPAARSLLNLQDSSQLEELFERVRREFGRRGTELVLLIEDLVSMSSIADPLLELAKRRPKRDSDAPLCAIRTAVACTPGRFHSYIETLRSRVEPYVVTTMSNLVGRELDDYVAGLAARYLNVTRIDPGDLREWFERTRGREAAPPVACDSCKHKTDCHASFGSALDLEVGTYPFNRNALALIARASMGPEGFNPRFLIKGGIDKFLRHAGPAIRDASFPNAETRRIYGISGVSPQEESLLKRKYDSEAAERLNSLITIWGRGAIDEVGDGAARAFGLELPAIDVFPRGTGGSKPVSVETATTVKTGPRDTTNGQSVGAWPPEAGATARTVQVIRDWRAGQKKLGQAQLKDLRDVIHPWVVDQIPWGEIMLSAGLSGKSAADSVFQGTCINFEDQLTKIRSGLDVVLVIPSRDVDDARLEAALGMEAILRGRHEEGWHYPGGDQDLATALNFARGLADDVVRKLTRVYGIGNDAGDPLAEVVFALWVANHLAGRSVAASAGTAERLQYILGEPPSQPLLEVCPESRGASWRARLKVLRGQSADWGPWSRVREVLLDHAGARKGRRGGVISLDVARLAPLLRESALKSAFDIEATTLPANGGFREVASVLERLRGSAGGGVNEAIVEEGERLNSARKRIADFLGESPDFERVAADTARLRTSLGAAAVSRNHDRIQEVSTGLDRRRSEFAAAWRKLATLNLEAGPMPMLRTISSIDTDDIGRLDRLSCVLADVLPSDLELLERRVAARRGHGETARAEEELKSVLGDLVAALRTVDGGEVSHV